MRDDDVSFTASSGDITTVTAAVVYDECPRPWRERLFTWPWRPWRRYRDPIFIDLRDD